MSRYFPHEGLREGRVAVKSSASRGLRDARSQGLAWRATALAVLAAVIVGLSACGPATKEPVTDITNRGSSSHTAQESMPPTLAGPLEPPESGAYLGVYQPPAPFDIAALDSYSRYSDKKPAILMWYQPWDKKQPREFDPAAVVAVYERGAVPMVTWEPWNPGKDANRLRDPANQPAYRLKNIINGKFDGYIRGFARKVKSVRGPVMIRLMHEMNGDWYPWCGTVNGNKPKEFVRAWRHVVDLFKKEGATNVTWVWSINHESSPAGSWNSYSVYYPGHSYVDWVSISGFNWGTSSPGTRWHPLTYWYAKPMAYLKSTGKPIVVSEFATVEEGGDKAEWIKDAYKRFRTDYPAVKAVIYYNKREWQGGAIQDWRINTSKHSREAYATAVSSSYYLGAPASGLAEWTNSLTAANWVYLRSLKPVY